MSIDEFTNHVEMKKKPACHAKFLAKSESGFIFNNKREEFDEELLTEIKMKACSTTMAMASAKNAPAAHSNGIFPLLLYIHSSFFPSSFAPTHVI